MQVPRPAPDFATAYLPLIIGNLFVTYPTVNNAQGAKLKAATIELTGGPRPIVDLSYPSFLNLLFGFGGGDGSVANVRTACLSSATSAASISSIMTSGYRPKRSR